MTVAESGAARTKPVATISDLSGMTRAELVDAGRELRRRVPRSSHAELDLPADRPDPIALLEQSNRGRLPDLVPVRYARMLESDFAFLRGSPVVMTWDLARTPQTGINVQACGDAHLLNFGAYATPDRRLTFDVNDFDETLPAPWEWDVKRLAASCAVAARAVGRGEVDASAARGRTGVRGRDGAARAAVDARDPLRAHGRGSRGPRRDGSRGRERAAHPRGEEPFPHDGASLHEAHA